MRVASAAPVAVSCLVLLAGCGSGGDGETPPTSSTQTVAPDDITGQANKLIGPKMPEGSTLDCLDPLAAEADATTTCTWTIPDGSTIGMTVTVTEIVDDRASLHFKNDDSVTPSPSS